MIQKLVSEIEGTEFVFEVGMASGLKHLRRLLRDQAVVHALAQAARNDLEVARIVLGRLVRLSRLRIDPRFENPNDIAIAAYLVVLSAASPQLCSAAVDEVLLSTNLSWAEQIARAFLEESKQVSAAETIVVDGTPDRTASVSSVEATFPSGFLDEAFRRLCAGASDATGSINREYDDATERSTDVASDSQYKLAA
jgi:hypothetical protein